MNTAKPKAEPLSQEREKKAFDLTVWKALGEPEEAEVRIERKDGEVIHKTADCPCLLAHFMEKWEDHIRMEISTGGDLNIE